MRTSVSFSVSGPHWGGQCWGVGAHARQNVAGDGRTDRCTAGDDVANGALGLFAVTAFQQIAVGAGFDGLDDILDVTKDADDDDFQVCQASGPGLAYQIEARPVGECQIQQQHLAICVGEADATFERGGGSNYEKAFYLANRLDEMVAQNRVILDDGDPYAVAARRWCCGKGLRHFERLLVLLGGCFGRCGPLPQVARLPFAMIWGVAVMLITGAEA